MPQLFLQEAHQTDILSHQWFCLSNEFAADSLFNYRNLIFNNTREIIDHVPEKLKPESQIEIKKSIRVNTFEKNMEPCFIDIKVSGNNHKMMSKLLLGQFYKKMIENNANVQTRATFGLYQANALIISINEVKNSSSIRLHPGLNPEENRIFIEYLEDLANLIS